jgi:hypothetical protein
VEHLRVVFQRLWEYDLLLNLFSSFVQKKVEFLNHIISETSAKTLLKHLEAIQAFLWPLDIRDLQGFLGLVNFYLRFIAAAARILLTLTSAFCSRKKVQIEWSPQMKATFGSAKATFCRPHSWHIWILQPPSAWLATPTTLMCSSCPQRAGSLCLVKAKTG